MIYITLELSNNYKSRIGLLTKKIFLRLSLHSLIRIKGEGIQNNLSL